MNSRISLYIVEEYFLTRTLYRKYFSSAENTRDFRLLGDFDNAEGLFTAMENMPADVILLNIQLPIINGLEATQIIKNKYPLSKVLVVTSLDSPFTIKASFALGADAYILDETPIKKMSEIIKYVINGNKWVEKRYERFLDQKILALPKSFDLDNLYDEAIIINEHSHKGKIL